MACRQRQSRYAEWRSRLDPRDADTDDDEQGDDDDQGEDEHGDDDRSLKDDDEGNEDCGTEALQPGAKVLEAELKVSSGEAVWTEVGLLAP
jgi:hypothetical protein